MMFNESFLQMKIFSMLTCFLLCTDTVICVSKDEAVEGALREIGLI